MMAPTLEELTAQFDALKKQIGVKEARKAALKAEKAELEQQIEQGKAAFKIAERENEIPDEVFLVIARRLLTVGLSADGKNSTMYQALEQTKQLERYLAMIKVALQDEALKKSLIDIRAYLLKIVPVVQMAFPCPSLVMSFDKFPTEKGELLQFIGKMQQILGDSKQYMLDQQAFMLSSMRKLDLLVNPNAERLLLKCPDSFSAKHTGLKLRARLAAAIKTVEEEDEQALKELMEGQERGP